MTTRKSTIYLLFTVVNIGLLCLMFVHAAYWREAAQPQLLEKIRLVESLQLTDLCLFTDARYTRHPTVTDINSAFQDYPMSFEHFPSGSLMSPPPHLKSHETY